MTPNRKIARGWPAPGRKQANKQLWYLKSLPKAIFGTTVACLLACVWGWPAN